MFCKLAKFELRQLHESVDLMLRTLEVLDTEGVDGDDLDTGFIADLQDLVEFSQPQQQHTRRVGMSYPSKSLESHIVSLYCLNVLFASEASVSIHHECNMLGYRALFDGADEQLAKLADGPGDRRRVCNPSGDSVLVKRSHFRNMLRFRIF